MNWSSSWSKFFDFDRIIPSPSRSASGPWCWVGRTVRGCYIHTIPVHNKDVRRLLERTSRDEPAYICLPEHASSFTQTKLVPEIYTKDEINEMFYGVCGEHEKNKEAFQMKLDARIDRYTRHGVDRQRSVQEARLVTANLKPKISLFYKISPDKFLP
ncbi:hypothetical protein YC2023_010788 [Brassica napus]